MNSTFHLFLVCDKNLEGICNELKDINQRIKHKKVLRGRLSAMEEQREKLGRQMRPGELSRFTLTC